MEIQAEIPAADSECQSKSKQSIADLIYAEANYSSSSSTSLQPKDVEVPVEGEDEDPLDPDFEYDLEKKVHIKEETINAEDEEEGSESDEYRESTRIKSGKTTSFPRPKLICKVDLMDAKYCSFQDRSYCSNCYDKLSCDNQGKKFADILCSRKAKNTERGSDHSFPVTVLDALEVIFELTKNSFLSEIILDEMEYSICWKCCSILSKLYKLYIEFADCCKPPSYIKSVITHNRQLAAHQDSINKDVGASDSNRENEKAFSDDGESLLNFEISFQEEDDSYFPPGGPFTSKTQRENTARSRRKRKHSSGRCKGAEKVPPVSEPPVKRGRGRPRKVPLPLTTVPITKSPTIQPSPVNNKKPDPRREKDRRLKYSCCECSARFSRPSRLKRHLAVHSGRKYVCAVCNAGFNFAIYLERHEATHAASGNVGGGGEDDSDSGPRRMRKGKMKLTTAGGNLSREERRRAHVCRDCGIVFTKPSGLLRHSRIHETVAYTCDQPECSREFTSKRLLIRHKIQDHLMNPSEVRSGDVKPSLGKLTRRRLQKENKDLYVRLDGDKWTRRYQCPECPQAFFRTDHIRRHARCHAEKNHICGACNAGFSLLKHLEVHRKAAHSEAGMEGPTKKAERMRKRDPRPRKKYPCPEADCEHVCSRSDHLEEHLHSKHNIEPPPVEPQKCPVCGLVVNSKARLETHLQRHRPLIRENNHECDICGKKYMDANNLRNHKFSHRLDKPYICDKCGFATKRSYQLTRHIEMVHVGTRSHLCTDCGQSFKKKQHLRDHEATHKTMEYRPYTCTMEGCTKAYRSRRNLRQHLEAHTGCKFQCETCGRIFSRKDNLKVHVDTVHLGKPGRSQKEKAKVDGGTLTLPAKKPRKPKLNTGSHVIHILPDEGPASDHKDVVGGQTHQVMIIDDANLQQLQHQQQLHHILTSPRIIQQGTVPGQSVLTIPNQFGEFFYTI